MSNLPASDDAVVAYYDLKRAPITFDFCHFIVSAAAYAAALHRPGFDLVLIADGFRNVTLRERSYSLMERQWRLWNLIIELTKIVPQIQNLSIARRGVSTRSLNAYPPDFHPLGSSRIPYGTDTVRKFHGMGVDVRIFQPSQYALLAADRLIGNAGGKAVTITLRKASFDPARDSRIEEWHEFAKILTARGYQPIIIPDQDDALGERSINRFHWQVIDVAAMSVDLRLAIYSRAAMNYVTSGGMVGLFMYTKVPFMWYSVLVDDSHVGTLDYYRSQGLEHGQKFPWLGDNQSMVWEPDTLANLEASLERIESAPVQAGAAGEPSPPRTPR